MRFHSRLVDQDETDSIVRGVGRGGAGGVFRRVEPQRNLHHACDEDGGLADPGGNAGLQQHRRVELPRYSRGQATPQLATGPADGGIRLPVRRQRPGAGDLLRANRRPARCPRQAGVRMPLHRRGRVEVFRQVIDRGERVGSLYIRANTDDLDRELAAYTKIVARRGLARPGLSPCLLAGPPATQHLGAHPATGPDRLHDHLSGRLLDPRPAAVARRAGNALRANSTACWIASIPRTRP